MPEPEVHLTPVRQYAIVLLLLLGLLALTLLMAFVNVDACTAHHHLGTGWNTIIALVIATAKAVLIFAVFMHLRTASRMARLFAAAGFLWLAMMLWLVLTDYTTRNHPAGANPKGEPRYLQPAEPTVSPRT